MKNLLTVIILVILIPVLSFAAVSPTDYGSQPHFGLMQRANLYSKVPGFQLGFGGLTTGAANNDTLYVAAYDWDGDASYDDFEADQWEGYGKDDYIGGGAYYLQVTMTADSAAPVLEYSKIIAFDSDAGMVIVSPAFSAAVGQGEAVMCLHVSQMPHFGVVETSVSMATGVDSNTVATAVGDVYVTAIYSEVTTVIASVADSCYWVADAGTGTTVARIDEGDDLNAAADETRFYVNSATLGTATLKTVQGALGVNAVFRLAVPDGTTLEFVSEGNATTGAVACRVVWEAAEPGAFMR